MPWRLETFKRLDSTLSRGISFPESKYLGGLDDRHSLNLGHSATKGALSQILKGA